MPPAEVAPPLSQGRYQLLQVLGSGGMATVYRAHDRSLDTERAIKILASALASRSVIRERFAAEARTMARLHHPNIVMVHDVGVDGDRLYIVMEVIDGGSLQDRLKHAGPLPVRQACQVTLGLLAALETAHEQGVIHRDIKPHNVLITRKNVVKVTDFGIARVQDTDSGLTKTGAMMGTVAYMAPEQRMSAKTVDARADLYATGATLFALATGREPYDLYNTAVHADVFEGVDPELTAFIQQACAYRAEDRFADAAAMAAALAALEEGMPQIPENAPPLCVVGEAVALPIGQHLPLSSPGSSEDTFDAGALNTSFATTLPEADTSPPTVEGEPERLPRLLIGAGILVALGAALAVGFLAMTKPDPEPGPEPVALEASAEPAPPAQIDEVAALLATPDATVAALTAAHRTLTVERDEVRQRDEKLTALLERQLEKAPEAREQLEIANAVYGGDPDNIAEATTFLSDLSPQVRTLFLRRLEESERAEALDSQLLALEARGAEAPEPAPAAQAQVEPTSRAARKTSAAPPRQTPPLEAPPEPMAPPEPEQPVVQASLTIIAQPYATVSLDGSPVGKTNWTGQVPVGNHEVQLTSVVDGRTATQTFLVRSGKPNKFCWNFDLDAVCPKY